MLPTSVGFVQPKLPRSNCGLVKNLALSAIISVSVPSAEIIEKLCELGAQHVDEANENIRRKGARVFVDGN